MRLNPADEGFLALFETIPGVKNHAFPKEVVVEEDVKKEKKHVGIKPIKPLLLYRYIVLMYDPKSPLVRDVSDYWQRKLESTEAAGFKIKDDGTLEKETEKFLLGENDAVNDVIIDYLAYMKSPTWDSLVFLYERLLGFTKESLSPQRRDSAKVDDVYKVSTMIQDLSNKLIGEDKLWEETATFRKRLMYRIEEKRLGIRPEDFAERLAKGDDLMEGSPYGNYKPSRIKFHGDAV